MLVWRLATGPIDAANEFLADVAAEDWVAAADRLDRSCFSDADDLPATLLATFGPDLISYNLTSTEVRNGEGAASGTITRTSFGEQSINFAMTKPGDDWLVCGIRF